MKAAQFSKYGGPEVVHVVDVDEPHAGPGQVRIAVRAAGVNPSDWKRRDGQYRTFEEVTFPSGFGVEASGVVDEVGPDVSNVAIGDAVFGFGENTMARGDSVPFGKGLDAPVVSLSALLDMKRAVGRPQDLLDIEQLERANR